MWYTFAELAFNTIDLLVQGRFDGVVVADVALVDIFVEEFGQLLS